MKMFYMVTLNLLLANVSFSVTDEEDKIRYFAGRTEVTEKDFREASPYGRRQDQMGSFIPHFLMPVRRLPNGTEVFPDYYELRLICPVFFTFIVWMFWSIQAHNSMRSAEH